nr:MAG TPA: hypothetical protein [Caudoviricetes sp.]
MKEGIAKQKYNKMASNVALRRAGYQPARKSRYSKSAKDEYGPAPQLL